MPVEIKVDDLAEIYDGDVLRYDGFTVAPRSAHLTGFADRVNRHLAKQQRHERWRAIWDENKGALLAEGIWTPTETIDFIKRYQERRSLPAKIEIYNEGGSHNLIFSVSEEVFAALDEERFFRKDKKSSNLYHTKQPPFSLSGYPVVISKKPVEKQVEFCFILLRRS